MPETSIEWATHVWNPFTGCDRVSPGCANCYAATAAASLKAREQGRITAALRRGAERPKVRYQADGDPKRSGAGFGFTVHWDKLENPERFPAGARVFVNSMSDVFHDQAPAGAIAELFAIAATTPLVDYLILTKRPERMQRLLTDPWWLAEFERRRLANEDVDRLYANPWPLPNVWLGVSIENRRFVHRADLLRQTPAAVRFISAEPLLGPLVYDAMLDTDGHPASQVPGWADEAECEQLDLTGIDWLIVGGESGKDHRPIDVQWVRDLRDACRTPGTSFFFKQWGGRFPRSGGRVLDGLTWDELPEPRVAG